MVKSRVFSSFVWSFLERFGAQMIGIIVNIFLARLLSPNEFGMLAIMIIFTNIANQLVQNGFNTSLIQNKDVKEEDYSSVLHVSMFLSVILYGLLFFSAPLVASFYEIPSLVLPFRVLALILFPGTLQSIQTAKLKRELNFKKIFYLTIVASFFGGVVGIVMAFANLGVWALVGQQLVGSVATCIALYISLRWTPKAIINWGRIGVLFRYGWKLLAAAVINTCYNDLTGLVIGKKYNTEMLAFYDKGQLFPQKVMFSLSDSIQNVMLPALSIEQDNISRCKELMRKSIQISSYVIFPLMAGLAAISTSLVKVVLTEKWLPCVPFMQLACLNYAFNPIASANLQAMKAMGRSDMFLKLEIIKKVIGLLVLLVTVFCFDSVLVIVLGTTLTIPLGLFINAYPNKRIVGYTFQEQIKDFLPNMILSLVMFACIYMISFVNLNEIIILVIQVASGILLYLGFSIITKNSSYKLLIGILQSYLGGRKK